MMASSNNRITPDKRDMGSNVETAVSSSCRISPDKRNMSRREDDNRINLHRSPNSPSRDEMKAVFQMCRSNKWTSVLNSCRSNSLINVTSMTMDNNISTTIIHQAITSKGDTEKRAIVVQEILAVTPHAAQIRNGYGSLPLHVISQRNTKMDSATKEILIMKLMDAYPMALTQPGGVGRRTPLHIIFTDYVSPRITEALIQRGRRSCFMIDKKGFLPAHVACSRHCSPEKLDMLLRVNPNSLFAVTSSGDTLLSLATKTATKSHPNYALINDIRSRLDLSTASAVHPSRVSSTDSSEQGTISKGTEGFGSSLGSTSSNEAASPMAQVRQPKRKGKRKRKVTIDDQDTHIAVKTEVSEQANLLLHFSRHMGDDLGKYIAQV